MTVDMSAFDLGIRNVKIALDNAILKTTRRVTMAVDASLVLSTPVDTGRARANWLVSVGSPSDEISDNLQIKSQRNISELESYTIGDTVYVSNNLPYIGKLNDGHSKQAPQGFIETAINSVKGI